MSSSTELKKLELWSSLTDLVESGSISDVEANEWWDMKVEQWEGGDR
jgi:hypothetical protein